MVNKHDDKRRPEVGVKDMDKYENGGLEVEERLSNGYLMYVPYGIHCDIFDAIEKSNRLISDKIQELQKIINELEIDNKYSEIIERSAKEQIETLEKHLHVLEKIVPIKHEI
ncbi:TPA: hypothetical protein ACORDH_002877 [Bacillus cereus]